ncbi:MAG: glycosyltransferase family A protein [Parvularcula sp.]|nr:glycosyltransferase family A protein [Parvularcula sp.]
MNLLTFIIPVRHQDNARDWGRLKENLSQTLMSVANQTDSDWKGIVVANEGADLPTLPDRFFVERVSFPPNRMYDFGMADREEVWDAVRADKGRRILAGMLSARDSRFFMIVDDDDLVSSRLVEHVRANPDANGWTINLGYLWSDGGRLLMLHDDLKRICGTTLIVRSDAYRLPGSFEDASLDWIKLMLGSHVKPPGLLAAQGSALVPFPSGGRCIGSDMPARTVACLAS